jgi:hypothetical protein
MIPKSSDEQISVLRKSTAHFKEQARLLLQRFERQEISQVEAIAEAERLGREVAKAERQVEQLEAVRRRKD